MSTDIKHVHDKLPAEIDVSVVVPVYNEVGCIRTTLLELLEEMGKLQVYTFEVVAVDDGSTDGTDKVLDELRRQVPALRVVTLRPNSGQSAAFGAGFQVARGAALVTMDADGQNDPADVHRLLDGLADCDCCCGYRANRQDTLSKKIGSRIGNGVRNGVLGEQIIDTGCSLKAFRAPLVKDLMMFDGMHRFLPSLLLMKGARVRQLPVNHRTRKTGRSKYTNFGRLRKTVWDLLVVRWMKNRYRRFEVKVSA